MKNRKGFSLIAAVVAVLAILALAYFAGIRTTPGAADNSIKKFASYAELESFVKANSQGYYSGGYGPAVAVSDMRAVAAESSGTATTAQTYSRTNIQVEGVDEADIVKTDGRYIYVVSANSRKVAILDAFPAETAKMISEINVSGSVNEIFVNKDRLIVFWDENVRMPVIAGPQAGMSEVMARPDILPSFRYSTRTKADIYDISDRRAAVLATNISVDGSYFDSRMMGDQVYVIVTQPAYYVKGESIPLPAIRSSSAAVKTQPNDFPDIYYFDVPDRYYAFTSIVSVNVNDGTVSGKMLLTGATRNLYVSANSIYITYAKYLGNIQESDKFIDMVVLPIVPGTVKGEIKRIRENSNLTRPEKWPEIQKALENYSKTLSEPERQSLELASRQKMGELQRELSKEREKTVVQKLSIGNGKMEYKTSGEVPGTILNQFSMDEHNGYFRIATTTTTEMGGITPMMGVMTSVVEDRTGAAVGTVVAVKSQVEPGITAEEQKRLEEREPIMVRPDIVPPLPSGPRNNVYVLDGDLKTVGKLEDLAPGEKIYSVRFMGDKAYLVTFRQIDPLFVIDLSQPAEPKLLGFLKIPGVSDYLHPYDESHIIGVGRDASEDGRIQGMKLSLFDVTNVSAPREISKYIIGQMGTDSEALRDHKAFLFSREKSLLVIPVSESGRSILTDEWRYWRAAYVFNLDLTGGFVLKGRISHMGNETTDDWEATVRRSMFIDDVLYTISNRKVVANKLSDMSEVSEVPLPQPTYEMPVYLIEETFPVGAVR